MQCTKDSSLKTKNTHFLRVRNLCLMMFSAVIIAAVTFGVAFRVCSQRQKAHLSDEYQHKIIVQLRKIQHMMTDLMSADTIDRSLTRNLALEYVHLGTLYDRVSTLSLGEWENIARILIGNYSPPTVPGLFQDFESLLSEKEIEFLLQLQEKNDELLSSLTNFSGSINAYKRILDDYNLMTLREFIAEWNEEKTE